MLLFSDDREASLRILKEAERAFSTKGFQFALGVLTEPESGPFVKGIVYLSYPLSLTTRRSKLMLFALQSLVHHRVYGRCGSLPYTLICASGTISPSKGLPISP